MSATFGMGAALARLDELRCAADVAAMVGATDAAVAIRYGDDLRIAGSVAGTFAERPLMRDQIVAMATGERGDRANWLTPSALRRLGLPPQSRVLALPAQSAWDGLILLRFDAPPFPSRYDLGAISAALRRMAPRAADDRDAA